MANVFGRWLAHAVYDNTILDEFKRQLAEEDEPDTHRLLNWEASVTVLSRSQDTIVRSHDHGNHGNNHNNHHTTTTTTTSPRIQPYSLNNGWNKKRRSDVYTHYQQHRHHGDDLDLDSSSESENNGNVVPKYTSLRHVTAHMTIGDDQVTLITNPTNQLRHDNGHVTPLPGFRRIHRYSEDGDDSICSSEESEEIPTLVPSGSLEDSEETEGEGEITMPSGNKVGDLEPSVPWRRLRPPITRGTSLPIPTSKDTRPKSAEFHLDLNQGRHKPPSGKYKGHVRSPSADDKHFLSLVRNGGNVREKLARSSPQRSPSPHSPSFLQRFGIFGSRRSTSKDKEAIKSSASMELPGEQNNNNNSTERKSGRTAAEERHRGRLRFRKYSAGAVTAIRDENQNQPPSPPIAVFSSDEDISSVPNTPKHNLGITIPHTPTPHSPHPLSTSTPIPAPSHPLTSIQHQPQPLPSPASSQPPIPPSSLSVTTSHASQHQPRNSNIPTRTPSSFWGTKRPRPISPRLEQEISTLLMSPTKVAPSIADQLNANSRIIDPESVILESRRSKDTDEIKTSSRDLRRGSTQRSNSETRVPCEARASNVPVPTTKITSFATRPTLSRLREQSRVDRTSESEAPVARYRRYGERKHHSADMVETKDTRPQEESGPPRRHQSAMADKSSTTADGLRSYARQRHHTIEVANIIIKTPDDEKERVNQTQNPGNQQNCQSNFVASNIERRQGGSHRNIGIDSYRRISPGGAYIVHMSPSRWSRQNSGFGMDNGSPDSSIASTSTVISNHVPVSNGTSKAQTESTNTKPTTQTNPQTTTNKRGSYSSIYNPGVNNKSALYSGSYGNHIANHRGSYGGPSTSNIPSRTSQNQRRTSSDDVTLFHHRVNPVSSSGGLVARSLSIPARAEPTTEITTSVNRLSGVYQFTGRPGSRSNSPHSIKTPTSLSARPESPMTPHPPSPRRSTPSSPHTSLPPSPATTSPRSSTTSDPGEEFLIGIRRTLNKERGVSPQDVTRGLPRPEVLPGCHSNGEKPTNHKTSPEEAGQVVRRRSPQNSPEKAGRERPKSECLTVRWADNVSLDTSPSLRRERRGIRERPKSDLGGAQAISEALEHYELRERVDSLAALPLPDNLGTSGKAGLLESRMKNRRMSTPHPIKMRSERSPPNQHRVRRGRLRRSRSAPDLIDRAKRTKRVYQASSVQAGDLAVQPADLSSDEEELEGCDSMSLETASETSSVSSIGRQAILDEIFEEEPPSYVEALWDHVTMDAEELGFRAGDVIEVTDMTDKDWWWGKLREKEGWFPATFVRLRANQEDTADDFAARVKEGMIDSDLILQRYSPHLVSKDQARTNVVNEIINAEREYVKRLRDVIEGYVEKCRKRPEMFTKEQMDTIFSNIEAIHTFSRGLLKSLEEAYLPDTVQKSQIGQVFLKHCKGFAIYSEYCNNHPHACEELRNLQKSKKFQHFFEACRLLQQMIEIPLEGFLLTPVQKICKYPLQLAELLKYTRTDHPDYQLLSDALLAMKEIAVLINERKRKMESLQKLEEWQDLVQDWEGPDLLERSSELIFCGELTKVTSSGWSQERIFFMFDYQIIYCKKDLLWRDIMVYKGHIDIENAEIINLEDGKDAQFNTTVRNGFKIYDSSKDKWFLLYARTASEKECWQRAFDEEKNRRQLDRKNGFCLEEYRNKIPTYSLKQKSHPDKSKEKGPKRKVSRLPFAYQHDVMKNIPSHVTLPRGVSSREALLYGQISHKKRGWNPFSSKKTKR